MALLPEVLPPAVLATTMLLLPALAATRHDGSTRRAVGTDGAARCGATHRTAACWAVASGSAAYRPVARRIAAYSPPSRAGHCRAATGHVTHRAATHP